MLETAAVVPYTGPCNGAAQTSARAARAPPPRLGRAARQRAARARDLAPRRAAAAARRPSASRGRSRCRRRRCRRPSMSSIAEQLARELAAQVPGPLARIARQPRRGRLGLGPVRAVRLRRRGWTRFTAQIPGRGKVELENIVTVVRGASQRTIVITAHRDNIGEGPRRQRQRLRHGRPDRARPRVRVGRRRDARAGAADAHTRLRLDRRRRVRRARRSPLRRELALPRERAGRDQPRCDRGLRAAAAADRRRHGAFALGVARPNCGRPRPRADRRRADAGTRPSASCSISASRSRSASRARSSRAAFRR